MYYDFELDADSDWIYADFDRPEGCTVFKMTVDTLAGSPVIKTYQVG